MRIQTSCPPCILLTTGTCIRTLGLEKYRAARWDLCGCAAFHHGCLVCCIDSTSNVQAKLQSLARHIERNQCSWRCPCNGETFAVSTYVYIYIDIGPEIMSHQTFACKVVK